MINTVSTTSSAKFFPSFKESFLFSFQAYKPIKVVLIFSAAMHFIEFLVCNIFFKEISTPFFIAPIVSLIDGKENFLYAHSIIRQYGFFVVQLSLIALFVATNPLLYKSFIRAFALLRLLMPVLGLYAYYSGSISIWHLLPSVIWEVVMAILLWQFSPRETDSTRKDDELMIVNSRRLFHLSLTPKFQLVSLQVLCLIIGVLWILWGFASTIFWEIGVANISSDKSVEANLINAMAVNHVVRSQQGVMLIIIGVITFLTARHPYLHVRMIDFILTQQIINALSAIIEFSFGTILIGQLFVVFLIQAITFFMVLFLYPNYSNPQSEIV